jgi:predicted transcriptional regulator
MFKTARQQEEPMYQTNGLTGSARIIYEDLCRLLAVEEPVSVDRLASESGYSRNTVIGALKHLRRAGLVEMEHEPGRRAEYRITEEEGMNLSDVFRAAVNLVALDGPEWMERMQNALVAHQIYDKGKHVRRLARKVGGDFRDDVERWLDDNAVLSLTQVWDLQEAYQMRDQVDAMIAEARERLTK